MPITREDVIYLYKCFFNRWPGDEESILWNMKTYGNFDDARKFFINSPEFQSFINKPVHYYPEAPRSFEKQPGVTLALATIVKNEAAQIETMLQSCLPIVDHIVVADTGSTDGTPERASSILKASGVDFQIVNIEFLDFAQARNAALDFVPKGITWSLMLDADEHLVPEDYQKWRDLLLNSADVWLTPRYNFRDMSKLEPVIHYPDFQQRLIRNLSHEPPRYCDPVHEFILGQFKRETAPTTLRQVGGDSGGPHIHHMGYAITTPQRAREKDDLYLSLKKAASPLISS